MPNRSILSMHFLNKQLKGIHLILEEHDLWLEKELNHICSKCKKYSLIADDCCVVRVLLLQSNFLA